MVELMQGISMKNFQKKWLICRTPAVKIKSKKKTQPTASCYPENLYEPFPETAFKRLILRKNRSFVLEG
jgi:hypothetical protein